MGANHESRKRPFRNCLSGWCLTFTTKTNCSGSLTPRAPEQIGFRKLQPHTLRAVPLLLYDAGLRVGEAVALTLQDVDLGAAVITIRDTKFHNTRLVPVGLKLNQAMAQYSAQRKEAGHSPSADASLLLVTAGGDPRPVKFW